MIMGTFLITLFHIFISFNSNPHFPAAILVFCLIYLLLLFAVPSCWMSISVYRLCRENALPEDTLRMSIAQVIGVFGFISMSLLSIGICCRPTQFFRILIVAASVLFWILHMAAYHVSLTRLRVFFQDRA